jgi:aryl-alcohol dehydrogenase-like predicted oxidoreductase
MPATLCVKKRRLGCTGLEVSEIGFGAWGIGRLMWRGGDDASSRAALERARELGINFFDTALAYGDGHSEKLIARAFKGREDSVIVATKIPPKNQLWPARPGIPLREVFPLNYVKECSQSSLRNLQRERVDLQQFHVWHPEWLEDPEWRQAVDWLKTHGKASFVGVSVNDHQPSSVISVLRTGLIDCIQVIYNVFDQSPEDELFDVCQKLDIGVIVRVPFDEGSLTGNITPDTRFHREDWRTLYFKGDRKREVWERVEGLRRDLGDAEPLPQTALRFCLSHPAVSTVIPGMRSSHHVEQNAAVSTPGPLPSDTLAVLRRHRWVRNYYPD